jgi:hypothetical protein
VLGHQFLLSRPPLPEAGPLSADLAMPVSEAPEADDNQDGDDAEESEEDTSSSTSCRDPGSKLYRDVMCISHASNE